MREVYIWEFGISDWCILDSMRREIDGYRSSNPQYLRDVCRENNWLIIEDRSIKPIQKVATDEVEEHECKCACDCPACYCCNYK